jgi:two-component sensor histidine kinase
MAAAEAYDLIAVDHHMPMLDGLATLAELHALPVVPSVIYVTGSDDSKLAVAALKAGAIDYVVKAASEDYFDLLGNTVAQALETIRLRRAKELAEAELRETNERLQMLLKEVNHRVANSLQLVSAFVSLQSRTLEDEGAKAALEDTQRRIGAISQVHKRLYTSASVEHVDMDEYLASIVSEMRETWSDPTSPRDIQLEAERLLLSPDKAVAVGVIVTELVTNACKYAYPAGSEGQIRVILRGEGDDRFMLRVEDDGVGMSPTGKIKGTGLGSRLVNAMANTLRTSIAAADAPQGVHMVLIAER